MIVEKWDTLTLEQLEEAVQGRLRVRDQPGLRFRNLRLIPEHLELYRQAQLQMWLDPPHTYFPRGWSLSRELRRSNEEAARLGWVWEKYCDLNQIGAARYDGHFFFY